MLFHLQHIAGLAGRSMWINDKFWNIISFSLFISISPYLMSFRFGRYAFANIVSSLYECGSYHTKTTTTTTTTTTKSCKWFFIFCLKITCFIEEGRKRFPFFFVITYTEIHFLPSFILFAQSAQLNHFLHDSFAL